MGTSVQCHRTGRVRLTKKSYNDKEEALVLFHDGVEPIAPGLLVNAPITMKVAPSLL